MSGCSPLILRVLASTVSTVNRASRLIKDIQEKGGDLGVVDKGRNDPQTEADRSAQRCIIGSLLAKFPELSVVGEEELPPMELPEDWLVSDEDPDVLSKSCPTHYSQIAEKDITVWVDPLDGTKEFTSGLLSHVTVIVGITYQGRPLAGVINQPFYEPEEDGGSLGRTVWAMKEVGYSGFTPREPPENKMIVVISRSHPDQLLEECFTKLQPDEVIRVGGAGHKVLFLLDGKAHAYLNPAPGTKRWDTCGCEAILETVGGILTDKSGQPYLYDKGLPSYNNKNGVLACRSREILETMVNLFKE